MSILSAALLCIGYFAYALGPATRARVSWKSHKDQIPRPSNRTKSSRAWQVGHAALALGNLAKQAAQSYHRAVYSDVTRAAPRFRIETCVGTVSRINGQPRRSAGTTRDISRTGVFFYASFRPLEGSKLQLMLTLPPEVTQAGCIPALLYTRVVRVEPGRAGDAFGVAVEIESWKPVAVA